MPPGSLVHVGLKRADSITVSVFEFNETDVLEREITDVNECVSYINTDNVSWINIDGVHDANMIESIGSVFGLHPLVLEDIMNTGQRPKFESFDSYLFFVLKMLYTDEKTKEIRSEQISIILLNNVVLCFQEKPGDIFDRIRNRIRSNTGRVRKMGADYLTYSLIDTIVDHYYVIMESIGGFIDELDDELIANPSPITLEKIHRLKADIIFLRKSIWPLRDLINNLLREESGLMKDSTTIYLRDVYDHTVQVMDTIETFRDIVSGMFEMYMSTVSNKMNEVMKVLTIFASIFIPLTFVAGLYGMNFNPAVSPFNMPELNWFYGYPFALIIMVCMVGLMLYYFKRKNWL